MEALPEQSYEYLCYRLELRKSIILKITTINSSLGKLNFLGAQKHQNNYKKYEGFANHQFFGDALYFITMKSNIISKYYLIITYPS